MRFFFWFKNFEKEKYSWLNQLLVTLFSFSPSSSAGGGGGGVSSFSSALGGGGFDFAQPILVCCSFRLFFNFRLAEFRDGIGDLIPTIEFFEVVYIVDESER